MTRLHDLRIGGYRQLRGQFSFGPRITVVFGPNEAGKSTLHEALSNAMFGFSPEDRRSAHGQSRKDQRSPWSGGPFGATLTMDDQAGRRVRVDWDFAGDAVVVSDDATGDELHVRRGIKQRDDWGLDDYVGIARLQHEQLCCLLQETLGTVRPDGALSQALQNAVERAASGERAVEDAEEALKKRLNALGIHGGHYNATAGGPLARLTARERSLVSSLEAAEVSRRKLDELASEEASKRGERAAAELQCHADVQAGLRAAVAGAKKTARDARALATSATLDVTDEEAALLPPGLPGRVEQARVTWRTAQSGADEAQRARKADEPELAAARQAVRDAEHPRDRLAAYADVDHSREELVGRLIGELGALAAGPVDAPRLSSAAVGVGSKSRGRRAAGLTVAGILAAVGAIAGAVLNPVAFALVAVAGVVAGWALLRRSASDDQAAGEGLPKEAPATTDEVDARRRDLLSQLTTALGSGGPGPTLEQAQAYLTECRRHAEYRQAELAVAQHAEALRQASVTASEHERALRSVEDAARVVGQLLGEAGIEGDDLDDGLERFSRLVEADRLRLVGQHDRDGAGAELAGLLQGRTLDQVEEAAKDADERLRLHVVDHGELLGGSADETDAETHRRTAGEIAERVAELAARRQAHEERAADPAELELELDDCRTRIGSIEIERDAIKVARERLATAAAETHRRVAPHLNLALESSLGIITRGRYTRAKVADDLGIKVEDAQTGRIVEVGQLSRGTQDQIALIQRLALTRILDPSGGTTPLLLDGCFAHTDALRLGPAIGLLREHAEHRQVVLFTDVMSVVDAVREAASDSVVIELGDPVGDRANAAGLAVGWSGGLSMGTGMMEPTPNGEAST